MTKTLEGKVALVTGGGRGIGAAIVRRLAEDGARIAFTYSKSSDAAKTLEKELNAWGGNVLAVEADSSDAEKVVKAIEQVRSHFGKLDILVNNAGVAIGGVVGEFPLEDFDRQFAVNVRGVFVASQEASRYMGEGSRIINIGSVVAERAGFPGYSVYAASKAAVGALTKGIARDLASRNITVNTVQPGPIVSSMTEGLEDLVKPFVALGRLGHGSEVASLVSYLAGPEASFITGAAFTADGGFLA
ncbi:MULTISPECIES: 3-oxoacyl-ACP reductase family protein [Rhizobium]|nr:MULTISPECIES: 3-oxoacyl-ACP reductase family protein [Rhizobium]MBB4308545.1 3-oxoacyl-[acyl-carrier protein] reductase [Rhizobium leguminosarum]MBB4416380.1 3-oxoacyl-[acyl-carrier protein] reductase [Rhizobium leguminosarum]MBB4430653.1 3-oxoacyl-[acyl-carrier protein] reductase [Rhizobium esperanzae]MBB4540731.1 3-oxoacyl-[acyl-carrier protein] reductase [Rhizobium leguminosarum]MBB5650878.1 3-oxoacyl-[acyl-carrier protein] reductase [Rhizobium leguminosarum]